MGTINLASIYRDGLMKQWKKDSLTSILENDSLIREVAGAPAHTVYVPTMTFDNGMKDYSKSTGYGGGGMGLTWEALALTQDRSIKMTLDTMDNAESMGVVGANALAEFQRLHVIPEIDAYRFAKIATMVSSSTTDLHDEGTISTGSALLAKFETAMATLDDYEVPEENRVLFLTPTMYNLLKSATLSQRWTQMSDKAVDRNIEYLDSVQIVRVPTGRFYTGWAKNTSSGSEVGGFTHGTGTALNFILMNKDCVLPVIKHNSVKVIEPDDNQSADGWILAERIYHDCLGIPNKASTGIYESHVAPAVSG